jgi:phage terminase small subunit
VADTQQIAPSNGKQSAKRRQEVFCRAYVIDMNATKAAIKAGYSKKGADVRGALLLGKSSVQAQIGKLMAEKAKKLDFDAEKVLRELCKMGFSNMLDYMRVDEDGQFVVDFSNLTREQAAAIQEYTVDATGGTGDGERKRVMRTRFKLADKARSLELLGQYLKLFINKVELSGDADILAALAAGRERVRSGKRAN